MHDKSVAFGMLLGAGLMSLLARAGAPPALLGIALLAAAGVVGLNLLQWALWPRQVERMQDVIERLPLRCFLVGILAALIWFVVVAAAGEVGGDWTALTLLGLGVLVPFAAGAPAAVARHVGGRVCSQADPAGQTAAGSLVLAAAALVPVLGWLLAGGALLAGLGSGFLSLRVREKALA